VEDHKALHIQSGSMRKKRAMDDWICGGIGRATMHNGARNCSGHPKAQRGGFGMRSGQPPRGKTGQTSPEAKFPKAKQYAEGEEKK